MPIVNYTPHPVIVVREGAPDETIPSACGKDNAPRVVETFRRWGQEVASGVRVADVTYGDVQGLPPFVEGTYVIVSSMVLDCPAVRYRTDLMAPLDERRDDAGRVTGCRSFRGHVLVYR